VLRWSCGKNVPATKQTRKGTYLAYELPDSVLRKLKNLFASNPLQLSETEQRMAGRIEVCSACNRVWFRRAKRKPDRCPQCHSRSWDRPLVAALMEAHKAVQPDPPTHPPKGGKS
jgi:predicted Zn-ribbon and HTH transcriptional regulator